MWWLCPCMYAYLHVCGRGYGSRSLMSGYLHCLLSEARSLSWIQNSGTGLLASLPGLPRPHFLVLEPQASCHAHQNLDSKDLYFYSRVCLKCLWQALNCWTFSSAPSCLWWLSSSSSSSLICVLQDHGLCLWGKKYSVFTNTHAHNLPTHKWLWVWALSVY